MIKKTDAESNIVVYSANIGNYSPTDHLKNNIDLLKEHGIKFFIFSDKKIKSIPNDNQIIIGIDGYNSRMDAKRFKILPQNYFHGYKTSMWIDANILIELSLIKLLLNFNDTDTHWALFKHDKRSSIVQEANICIRRGKDSREKIINQLTKYKKNYNEIEKMGLYQGRILIRKFNEFTNKLNIFWFEEIDRESIRDQISLPIVISKLNKKNLLIIEPNLDQKYFRIFFHNKYQMYNIKFFSLENIRYTYYKIKYTMARQLNL